MNISLFTLQLISASIVLSLLLTIYRYFLSDRLGHLPAFLVIMALVVSPFLAGLAAINTTATLQRAQIVEIETTDIKHLAEPTSPIKPQTIPTSPIKPQTIPEQKKIQIPSPNEATKPSKSTKSWLLSIPQHSYIQLVMKGLFIFWLVGTSLQLIRFGYDIVNQRRELSNLLSPNDKSLAQTCSRMASKIGIRKPVKIAIDPVGRIPFCYGLLNQTIVIPQNLLELLDQDQLEIVMTHELAHIKRNDLLLLMGQRLSVAFHWWNPLILRYLTELDLEREIGADRITIKFSSSQALACLLVELASLSLLKPAPILAAAMARQRKKKKQNYNYMKKRIDSLLAGTQPSQLTAVGKLTFAIVLGTALAFGPFFLGFAQGADNKFAATHSDKVAATHSDKVWHNKNVELAGLFFTLNDFKNNDRDNSYNKEFLSEKYKRLPNLVTFDGPVDDVPGTAGYTLFGLNAETGKPYSGRLHFARANDEFHLIVKRDIGGFVEWGVARFVPVLVSHEPGASFVGRLMIRWKSGEKIESTSYEYRVNINQIPESVFTSPRGKILETLVSDL